MCWIFFILNPHPSSASPPYERTFLLPGGGWRDRGYRNAILYTSIMMDYKKGAMAKYSNSFFSQSKEPAIKMREPPRRRATARILSKQSRRRIEEVVEERASEECSQPLGQQQYSIFQWCVRGYYHTACNRTQTSEGWEH